MGAWDGVRIHRQGGACVAFVTYGPGGDGDAAWHPSPDEAPPFGAVNDGSIKSTAHHLHSVGGQAVTYRAYRFHCWKGVSIPRHGWWCHHPIVVPKSPATDGNTRGDH